MKTNGVMKYDAEDIISSILSNDWEDRNPWNRKSWQMATANAREMATANYTQRRVFPVESKIRVLFCPRVGPWRDAMYNIVRLSYCQTTALRGFVIYTYNKNNKQSSYLHNTCGFAAFFTVVLSQSKDSESKTLHTFIFVNTRCMHTFESVVTRSLPTNVGAAK